MQTNARPVALRSRGMVSASQIEAGTPPILTKTKVSGMCRCFSRCSHGSMGRTQIVCTLGPKSRSVEMIEALLRAGMSIARFNFSHGAHEYHQARSPRSLPQVNTSLLASSRSCLLSSLSSQETLDALHRAQQNTGLMCAVLLDTKGPEIRTGFLKARPSLIFPLTSFRSPVLEEILLHTSFAKRRTASLSR